MSNGKLEKTLASVKEYAKEHHVPIMEEQGISYLLDLLREQQPKRILEIGAAIGFSAIKMAEALPGAFIDTIERDEIRCRKAMEFIELAGLEERIRIFQADALEMDLSGLQSSYDAIFIDAAKGQYERFFEKYEVLINSGGIVYCDNMHMHGMADIPLAEVPRRKRTMIRNLKSFRDRMLENPGYQTELLDSGDGIMVCEKK